MKSKTTNKATQAKPAKNTWRGPALVAGSLVLLSGIVWGALWIASPPASPSEPAGPPKLAALVATLSPDLFTGKAREAYQAAKDVPEVLQHMPCFCGCPRFGHKNNLYCFHDQHGEECDMCQDIAIEAKALHKEGTAIDKIVELIRAKYGPKDTDSH